MSESDDILARARTHPAGLPDDVDLIRDLAAEVERLRAFLVGQDAPPAPREPGCVCNNCGVEHWEPGAPAAACPNCGDEMCPNQGVTDECAPPAAPRCTCSWSGGLILAKQHAPDCPARTTSSAPSPPDQK
jgi:hypothetical protein